jgi:hypothetical protein
MRLPSTELAEASKPPVTVKLWVLVVSLRTCEANWRSEVAGVVPAPPPRTTAFAPRAAEDAHVLAELKYGIPPDVPATVNASVPLPVTGEPATESNPPVKEAPTLVTVPVGTAPPSVRVQVVEVTVQVTR